MALRAFSSSPSTWLESDRESTSSHVMDRVRKISTCLAREIDGAALVYAMGALRRSPDRSMAAIYVLPRESEPGFIEKVKASTSPPTYDFGAKRDPQYLIYMVDADSTESSTGIYEIVSMGYRTAGCIKECFDNF